MQNKTSVNVLLKAQKFKVRCSCGCLPAAGQMNKISL